MATHKPMPDRFWEKVNKTPDCWIWTACKHVRGYGLFFDPSTRKLSQAHRVSYRLTRGAIPDGLTLDHLCRNHSCVNPDHLEAVTQSTNIFRGISPSAINRVKTRCIHGHPLSGDNLVIATYTRGSGIFRGCRICRREANRRWRLNMPSTQNILDVADQASGNAPLTDGFQVGDEGVGGTVEGHGRSPMALSGVATTFKTGNASEYQASPADSQFQGTTIEALVDAVFRAEERAAEIERVQK